MRHLLVPLAAAAAVVSLASSSVLTEAATYADSRSRLSTASAQKPTPLTRLGVAHAGYSLGRPAVLVTRNHTVLVAWREYLNTPNRLVVVHKHGKKKFTRSAVPVGSLESFGDPYLTEDTVNDRILLSATAYAAGVNRLGTYVWRSMNSGATWSGPTRVWDSLGTGQIALDTKGGFWTITGATGVTVTHVPADLTTQHFPGDEVTLSTRIASRGAVGIATAGPKRRLFFMFDVGTDQTWVHYSATPGNSLDTPAVPDTIGGTAQIAGNAKACFVVGIRKSPATGNTTLWGAAQSLNTGGGAWRLASDPRRDDPVSAAVAPIPNVRGRPTRTFAVVWVNSNGTVRMATSRPDWKFRDPTLVVRFPSGPYSNPSSATPFGHWVAILTHNSRNAEVQTGIQTG